MKDYRNDPKHPECHGIEPVEWWVVSNFRPVRLTPMKVQGFLGAYAGRPDHYWFPEVGYSATPDYVYDNHVDACLAALDRVNQDQDDIDRRLNVIKELLS